MLESSWDTIQDKLPRDEGVCVSTETKPEGNMTT